MVPVLGDVGEEREVAERAHHRDRLLDGEGIERAREEITRGHVLEAPARHGKPADVLDQVESGLALVGADGVAEEPAEKPDILPQPCIFIRPIIHT